MPVEKIEPRTADERTARSRSSRRSRTSSGEPVRCHPCARRRLDARRRPDDDELRPALAEIDDEHPTAVEERATTACACSFARPAVARARARAVAHDADVDLHAVDVPDEDWAERSQAALGPVAVGGIDRDAAVARGRGAESPRRRSGARSSSIQPSMGFGTGITRRRGCAWRCCSGVARRARACSTSARVGRARDRGVAARRGRRRRDRRRSRRAAVRAREHRAQRRGRARCSRRLADLDVDGAGSRVRPLRSRRSPT